MYCVEHLLFFPSKVVTILCCYFNYVCWLYAMIQLLLSKTGMGVSSVQKHKQAVGFSCEQIEGVGREGGLGAGTRAQMNREHRQCPVFL